MRSSVVASAVAALFGAVSTLVIVATPVQLGYRSPALHLVLETAESSVALLAAYLMYGRFRRRHRLQDFLLLQTLVLWASASLVLTVGVGVTLGPVGPVGVWLPLAVRLVAGALLVAAALSRKRLVRSPFVRHWGAVPAVIATLVLVVVMGWQHPRLPPALGRSLTPFADWLGGHPALNASHVLLFVCFLTAGIAFTAEATRHDDELLYWLGPACVLAAFARVHFLVFPSIYSGWVYTGDFLRAGFYFLLLVGSVREIAQYRSAQMRSAVMEDRRRLARELHDGALQELAYIRAEASSLPAGPSERGSRITAATDRAIDELRAAVDALGRMGHEPLGYTLHRAAAQVAERYGAGLELDLDDSIDADQDQRHALSRIVREAIANAARHGGARRVRVQLTRVEEVRQLVVADDGTGFDVAAVAREPGGFGLTSMRERAEALPGVLLVDSSPGSGTTLTVRW